jgi:hypothetical protein
MSCRWLSAFALAATATLTAGAALAQSVVSARSGTIHHVEGRVLMDDEVIQEKFGEFRHLEQNSVLRTERGRAEMLLTPGVVVRMTETSAVRMISNKLSDTRLELLEGSALVECMELLRDNAITFYYQDSSIQLLKEGLYRIDASPPRLRVYKGKAQVASDDQVLTADKGKLVDLDGVLVARKFDTTDGDPLYRWSSRRSSYLAMANLSAAKSVLDSGISWSMGGWRWNPFFGMMTFLPARGSFHSPFGYSFWSPRRVYYVYTAPRQQNLSIGSGGGGGRYNANLGYVTATRSASGSSSSGSVAGSSASAAPATSPRVSGSASPRSGRGGGTGR